MVHERDQVSEVAEKVEKFESTETTEISSDNTAAHKTTMELKSLFAFGLGACHTLDTQRAGSRSCKIYKRDF